MRYLKWWIAGAAAVLLLLYLGAGFMVWSRNQVPALDLPPRKLPPADNAYSEYVDTVPLVQRADLIQRLALMDDPPYQEVAAVIRANESVLRRVRSLSGRPSVVTSLRQSQDFVGGNAYPNLTRLVALYAQHTAGSNPSDALDALLDGFDFCEGVMRGGANLHLDIAYNSYIPLFRAAPAILQKLPPALAKSGAERLRKHLESAASLQEILQNERRVRREIIVSVARPISTRYLRLDFPGTDFEKNYLFTPKAEAAQRTDAYLQKWLAEADKPPSKVIFPPPPDTRGDLVQDDTLNPNAFGQNLLNFHLRDTRLRLMYAALRLQAARPRGGDYPAGLPALGNDPLLQDPFGNGPFQYRRKGGDYSLYSLGPNLRDDGGRIVRERALRPNSPGDVALAVIY